MPFSKQRTLLSISKINLKQVLNTYIFSFFVGQLVFIWGYTLWRIMAFWGRAPFDVVLFPGLAKLGFYDISIGPYHYLIFRALAITIFEAVIILIGYLFARRFGRWIIKWVLLSLVIINLTMVIYW